MFCTNCGKQLPDDVKFCTACGAPVAKITPRAEELAETEPSPVENAPVGAESETMPTTASEVGAPEQIPEATPTPETEISDPAPTSEAPNSEEPAPDTETTTLIPHAPDENPSMDDTATTHIAAAAPSYVSKDEVPSAELEKEREILIAQAKNEPNPKPDAIIHKMVDGRIQKYYKDVCLMEQVYVRDSSKTISQLVTEAIASIGEKITVRRFVRYQMGEGLQKREDNFAEEVMAQAGLNK